jgi:hypothetical protein
MVPLSSPAHLCTETSSPGTCRPAEEVLRWFRSSELQIVEAVDTPGGTQDAQVLTLAVPGRQGRQILRAKWRALASGGLFSDPRKELGAFAVQTLFLEPEEYVIPPTAGHCFPLAEYRDLVDDDAMTSFEGVSCVYGILSYWLPDVRDLEDADKEGLLQSDTLLDAALLEREPAFRRSVANLNIVTYLVRHGDAHNEQFLLARGPDAPHVYVVDNSIAFESIKNPMLLFREDWSTLRVRSLPEKSAARLRQLDQRNVASLAVIEQATATSGGLAPSRPEAPHGDLSEGVRWNGKELQVGLTRTEIEGVWVRLQNLVRRLESQEIGTF